MDEHSLFLNGGNCIENGVNFIDAEYNSRFKAESREKKETMYVSQSYVSTVLEGGGKRLLVTLAIRHEPPHDKTAAF